mmetsp:Transcript_19643/g.32194  ORF Transcript_19643/g.32194 Transcript_19643/m.32194 type:complete len:240 (-) Transcript_19643:1614-2333(-)
MVSSSAPVRRWFPSGLKVMQRAQSKWPFRTAVTCHVSVLHILMLLSSPAEAMSLALGLNADPHTTSVWPTRVVTSANSVVSQTLRVQSPDPVTIHWPLRWVGVAGAQAQLRMFLTWRMGFLVAISFMVSTSHIFAVASQHVVNSRFPSALTAQDHTKEAWPVSVVMHSSWSALLTSSVPISSPLCSAGLDRKSFKASSKSHTRRVLSSEALTTRVGLMKPHDRMLLVWPRITATVRRVV